MGEPDVGGDQSGGGNQALGAGGRKRCHAARDVYFSCMQDAMQAELGAGNYAEAAVTLLKAEPEKQDAVRARCNERCEQARAEFHGVCPSSWTVYFMRMFEQQQRQAAHDAASAAARLVPPSRR